MIFTYIACVRRPLASKQNTAHAPQCEHVMSAKISYKVSLLEVNAHNNCVPKLMQFTYPFEIDDKFGLIFLSRHF